ncbi:MULTISPECIES: hypothetical protein [unclassified Coleofasciculus]|uniref:hypothetical protein n=1 Tax=unclassified Coleofasciculus TaxID=2692782 RepID=UPI0018827F73|nr:MULTISPECIES: hypothetical protein [unclassified Coleofasciculus]MBE9130115.1 hypothetical protein [Coleofasciculus sp. LEGE 07081]MBE9152456.1 hypothetical protein [Coleofasciculus sp. LEGE 07092]
MSEEATALEEIADQDELYRRLSKLSHIKKNGKVSSAAFKRNKQPENSISVDLARLTTRQESLARVGEERKAQFVLGVLVAGYPRSLGFFVRHDPLQNNYAHSLIEGQNDGEKCNLLAEATTILNEST